MWKTRPRRSRYLCRRCRFRPHVWGGEDAATIGPLRRESAVQKRCSFSANFFAAVKRAGLAHLQCLGLFLGSCGCVNPACFTTIAQGGGGRRGSACSVNGRTFTTEVSFESMAVAATPLVP